MEAPTIGRIQDIGTQTLNLTLAPDGQRAKLLDELCAVVHRGTRGIHLVAVLPARVRRPVLLIRTDDGGEGGMRGRRARPAHATLAVTGLTFPTMLP